AAWTRSSARIGRPQGRAVRDAVVSASGRTAKAVVSPPSGAAQNAGTTHRPREGVMDCTATVATRRARAPVFVLAAIAVVIALPAQAQEPIKIGFSVSLTGGLASSGKAHLMSKQIWAEEINAKGGLIGRPVKLVYYDDQTNAATVPGIYAKLV